MYFQLFPPTHIHEGHHISSLGYSCIKDTTNRNIEHFVHFHVLFMSFSCFTQGFHFFCWFIESSFALTSYTANTLLPGDPLSLFAALEFHLVSPSLLQRSSFTFTFSFTALSNFTVHLLSRTIKRENPVLPENIPRIPGIWTSSWQKQKLCFYWVELCYNINSSPN